MARQYVLTAANLASTDIVACVGVAAVGASGLSGRGGSGNGNAVLGINLLDDVQSIGDDARDVDTVATSSCTNAIEIAASKLLGLETRIIAFSSGQSPSTKHVV